MKRVVVDRYGGPEVLRVLEDDDPRPGPGEVRVRVLAAGVSFTDAQLRAGTYLGVPKPPFTPGYELVGVVEELGPGCSRLRAGDRVGALTVWGADAERVCVPEANAVEVPEDLDPAEVVSLVFTYMTAYQLLHRTAKVRRGETLLVHGAAGRVGTAVLELGAVAGLRIYGTCSARDRAAVERLGATAIDYRNEDFLARVRALTDGKGVDVVLDGLGGKGSLRSFRALRPGGRLVVYGHYATLSHGHKNRRAWVEWYAATAAVALWGLLSPRRRVSAYRIQKLRAGHQALPVSGGRRALPVGGGPRDPEWFREDFRALLELLRRREIHPVVAERLPLSDARRAHELLESSAAKGKLVLVP
jgi:NADPH:quinone reductase-like Zn-dependent oxidoreductase